MPCISEKRYVFMQDKAPCHCSKSTRTFLENKNVPLLDWHGNGPDLNPIENWRVMKKEKGFNMLYLFSLCIIFIHCSFLIIVRQYSGEF